MGELDPPRFEIEDLNIPKSDPLHDIAVKCVKTYWKQATNMTFDQCTRYLSYLQRADGLQGSTIGFPNFTLNSHVLYQLACDDTGKPVANKASWPEYLLLSTLYSSLVAYPSYMNAIKVRFGTTLIGNFTNKYRRIYPEPRNAKVTNMESASMSQPGDATPPQKNTWNLASSSNQRQSVTTTQKNLNKVPAPTCNQEQNTTSSRKRGYAMIAPINQQEDSESTATRLSPTSTMAAQPAETKTWDIDNVVAILGQVKRKRLSSSSESSAKQVKASNSELLAQVNQQNTMTVKSVDQLRSVVEEQGVKIQEVREVIEQNKQALNNMQSELRQFMSAVAATLRDIQERLEE